MTPSTTSAPQQRSPEAAANVSFEMSATTLNQGPQTIQSQLDRGAAELLENPKLLEVQVKSAKSHLQGKQKTPWKFSQMFIRGTGQNLTNCKKIPCNDVSTCNLKDKHPELLADIRILQCELKQHKQKFETAKSDHEVFAASRQRAKSSFFDTIRARLRKQNPAKYADRSSLDRNLMILQRALKNKVHWRKLAIGDCQMLY